MAAGADGYTLLTGAPGVADYCRLRRISGLSEKTEDAAAIGLAHSWFGVRIVKDGTVVGMGRVIGDGGCFFQVCDIAVDPAHQGRGLGKRIMAAIVEHLHAHAPKSAYVSLIADGDAQYLYAQYGFKHTAPASVGMAFLVG